MSLEPSSSLLRDAGVDKCLTACSMSVGRPQGLGLNVAGPGQARLPLPALQENILVVLASSPVWVVEMAIKSPVCGPGETMHLAACLQ